MYTKPALTIADAKQAAAAAIATATANGWNVTIAILDEGANLLYLERMDGAPLASIGVAPEKGRTAILFKRPTKALEEIVAGGRTVMMMLPGATPIEGGLPLIHNGTVVGAIGVSGVQSHQDSVVAQAAVDVVAGLTA
jgi:glc operon protein GlcG